MLTKETADKLKGFGFDVEKLSAAIRDVKEVAYDIPDLLSTNFLTEDALETRDAQMKQEGHRAGVIEGKTAGTEIAAKMLSKKFGVTVEDAERKDFEKVLSKVHETVAKGDPEISKRLELLQSENDKLIKKAEKREAKYQEEIFNTHLLSNFPSNRSDILNESEYLLAVKNNLKFTKLENGTITVSKAANPEDVYRDTKTKAPLPMKDAIHAFFNERKWVKDEGAGGASGKGGRGAGDNHAGGGNAGGAIKTMSKAKEQFLSDNPGKNITGHEFQSYLAKVSTEHKDFNFDE